MLAADDAYFFGFIILVIAEIILIIKKIPLNRNLLFAIFIIYCTLIASVTFFPIIYSGMGYDLDYNFIPFKTIIDGLKSGKYILLRNLAGNVIMFLPLGILLQLIFKKKRFFNILLLSVAFAISIELIQSILGLLIGSRYRSVDVDDVFLNTLGSLIGYGLYKIAPRKLKEQFE